MTISELQQKLKMAHAEHLNKSKTMLTENNKLQLISKLKELKKELQDMIKYEPRLLSNTDTTKYICKKVALLNRLNNFFCSQNPSIQDIKNNTTEKYGIKQAKANLEKIDIDKIVKNIALFVELVEKRPEKTGPLSSKECEKFQEECEKFQTIQDLMRKFSLKPGRHKSKSNKKIDKKSTGSKSIGSLFGTTCDLPTSIILATMKEKFEQLEEEKNKITISDIDGIIQSMKDENSEKLQLKSKNIELKSQNKKELENLCLKLKELKLKLEDLKSKKKIQEGTRDIRWYKRWYKGYGLQEGIDTVQEGIDTVQEEINIVQKKINSAQKKINSAQEEIDRLKKETLSPEAMDKLMNLKRERFVNNLHQLTMVEFANNKYKELKKAKKTITIPDIDEIIQSTTKKNADNLQLLEKSRNSKLEKLRSEEHLKSQLEKLQSKLINLESTQKIQQKMQQKIRQKMYAGDELQKSIDIVQEEINIVQEKINSVQKEIKSAQENMNSVQKEIKSAQEEIDRLEKETLSPEVMDKLMNLKREKFIIRSLCENKETAGLQGTTRDINKEKDTISMGNMDKFNINKEKGTTIMKNMNEFKTNPSPVLKVDKNSIKVDKNSIKVDNKFILPAPAIPAIPAF